MYVQTMLTSPTSTTPTSTPPPKKSQGGLALGEAVKSSGLLTSIAQGISEFVDGFTEWQVLAVFCGLVLVFTSFISHTVGAMVILPVLQSIGVMCMGNCCML